MQDQMSECVLNRTLTEMKSLNRVLGFWKGKLKAVHPKSMKYLRCISLARTRIGCCSKPSNDLHHTRFPSSKSLHFTSTSLSNVFRKPNLAIPNGTSIDRVVFARESTSPAQESKFVPSDRVSAIVHDISGLTLLEVADLTEVLRKKLDVNEMPIMAVMMPGMGVGGKGGVKGGGSKAEEKKAEKTTFDLKLEGFDAAAKIKIIKEVRTFTDLGLKEAKDLVEKAPAVLKKGVLKEEAEKIIEKMKEVGAKVVME